LEELLQRNFRELCAPDQLARTIEHFERGLREREVVQLETAIIRKDGRRVELWIAGEPATVDGKVVVHCTAKDITERKQAEAALRESDRFIHSVAEASPHCFYVFDFDNMGLTYNNRSILQDLGYPPEVQATVTGFDAFRAYMPPEELPHLARLTGEWQQLADGVVRDDEYRLRHADGTLRYFAGREVVFARGADGRVTRILGSLSDITERKQVEEALRESEARYRGLFENMRNGFAYCRMIYKNGQPQDFIYLAINPAFMELTGLKNVVGKKVSEIIPGIRETDPKLFEIYGRVASTGVPEQFEVYVEALGMWFAVSVYSPAKEHFAAVFDVVTERKQAEQKLRESLERLKRVLEVETVGVMFWDLNTSCMVDANDAFLKLMGYSRSEVEARELTWQKLTPPEYLEVSRAEIRKFQATGRVGPYEKEYFRKDGTRQWLLFAGSSLGNNQCVEFCVDISDRKKTEAALRETEARAKVAEAVQLERQRLEEVLNLLPAYVVLLTPDYHVPFANRFFEERFGKSEGRRCYEYLFQRTEPCGNCQAYNVVKSKAPQRWEWTGPDGRNYDIYDFPFTEADGSPLIMEVGLDITERKKAETELKKHREHLEDLVRQRTKELRSTNAELTRFNQAMVGRELRMIELKEEVNSLCAQLGRPARYSPRAEPDTAKGEHPTTHIQLPASNG
jgi:PAS domain S-box-containing protein